MATVKTLPPEALYQRCDPEHLNFETTAEIEELHQIVGQDRAVEAVRFGIGIRRDGYNIFALGPTGTGKQTTVQRFFKEQAAQEETPPDWCYVNNFADPYKPQILELPPGTGRQLRQDMDELVEELRTALPAAFESEEYRNRRQVIEEEFKERQEQAFNALQEQARAKSLTLLRTPGGLVFAPVREGDVLSPEEFEKLPPEEKQAMEAEVETLQQELQRILQQLPAWERELRRRLRELNQETTHFAVGHLLDELHGKYAAFPDVVEYLNAIQRDVTERFRDFLHPDGPAPSEGDGAIPGSAEHQFGSGPLSPLRRYRVNLLVDHSGNHGAPVVYEDNPTYSNLIGRVEYMAQMGALITDFNLIKPGSLHRANGGYLLLEARKLLMQPFAWEGLKRALQSQQIRIESPMEAYSTITTVSPQPEPIPLQVKVALTGDRLLYYLLCQHDPEFPELFKVAADFNEEMDRDQEQIHLYAHLIATLARQKALRPLDRSAVARIIEQSSRMADDTEKLSMRMNSIEDLLQEADYWAGQASAEIIQVDHIVRAIDAQIYRANRVEERIQEIIRRDVIRVETDGARVGQVNGLSVLDMGNYTFGRPNRITARVRMGQGAVLDIEREVELGGALHSKGVLILSSYLGAHYAAEHPLSLSASLVFEQSYSGVEGDSASSAELYALLSAIAGVPIKQSLAVTGSVDQMGNVQAIGGVNQKIEGFFAVCKARGLTGEQGVLIPAANVKNLMLRQEVVEAVAAGQFHIYPVVTIDQGIEILTGVPAGVPDEEGTYPEGSVNQRVEARLAEFAKQRQIYNKPETNE